MQNVGPLNVGVLRNPLFVSSTGGCVWTVPLPPPPVNTPAAAAAAAERHKDNNSALAVSGAGGGAWCMVATLDGLPKTPLCRGLLMCFYSFLAAPNLPEQSINKVNNRHPQITKTEENPDV